MQRIGIVRRSVLFTGCAALLAAAPARAQSGDWSDKAFVNVNLSWQVTARPFDDQLSPIIYSERASFGGSHRVDGGKLTLDAGTAFGSGGM